MDDSSGRATKTITPKAALLWLAGLEKECEYCNPIRTMEDTRGLDFECNICNEVGKVPVLDLREPCNCAYVHRNNCPRWRPKQGQDALLQAMSMGGWDYKIASCSSGGVSRLLVAFWRCQNNEPDSNKFSSNIYIAAYNAMKEVGYE